MSEDFSSVLEDLRENFGPAHFPLIKENFPLIKEKIEKDGEPEGCLGSQKCEFSYSQKSDNEDYG